MRAAILVFVVFILTSVMASGNETIYLIPGQGSDGRIFQNIEVPGYNIHITKYIVPERNESMAEYALRLSESIDTTQPYSIVGVSLGGMLASEMSRFMNARKVILISSAKCRDELPLKYRWGKYLPLYKLLPGSWLRAIAVILQPIVEPDCKSNRDFFSTMLKAKNPKFMKRSINMIVRWNQKNSKPDLFHIHGDKDNTLPYKRIKNASVIKGGSHMMVCTMGAEISKILLEILNS